MNKKRYVNKVLSYLDIDKNTRKKISSDLFEMLAVRSEEGDLDSLEEPKVLANEFAESMGLNRSNHFEYVSSTELFGLPLIHLNTKYNGTAKGIIAVGAKSIGIFSFGGLSIGVFSLGGISAGLLAIGGLSLALLGAIGGVAVALEVAVGALAISNSLALGAVAISREIAIGSVTIGDLVLYKEDFSLLNDSSKSYNYYDQIGQFKNDLKIMYPSIGKLKEIIINLLQ